jgi:DNA-binding transcriptional MerR regulator
VTSGAPDKAAAEKAAGEKAAGAFRTIGELSRETGLPQHILRYWETRFSQLRPLQRAGNRRYYRPADIALVLRIQSLLDSEGYTIRGVQKLVATEGKRGAGKVDLGLVQKVRDSLADGLEQDEA